MAEQFTSEQINHVNNYIKTSQRKLMCKLKDHPFNPHKSKIYKDDPDNLKPLLKKGKHISSKIK